MRHGFQSCAGILAGATWTVEGTCDAEPGDGVTIEGWARAVLTLDSDACANAAQGLTSRWSGTLSFQEGGAIGMRGPAWLSRIEGSQLRQGPCSEQLERR